MVQGLNSALADFKQMFRDDLLDSITNSKSKYRAVVAGGYGLKTLLETKYDTYNKIKTGDLDITVTSFPSRRVLKKTFKYFVEKVMQFVHSQSRPTDFQVKLIDQANEYVPIFDYHKYAVILITYKGNEFVDIAFTDLKISLDMIDKPSSIKAGIPLKTMDSYLHDLLTLIYLANVSDVYPYLYNKQNPINGLYFQKGIKNIERASLVCNITKSKKYVQYCGLINRTSIEDLKTMTVEERDNFFKKLSSLNRYRERVTKQLKNKTK